VSGCILCCSELRSAIKFRPLFGERRIEEEREFCFLDVGNGKFPTLTRSGLAELTEGDKGHVFKRSVLTSSGYTPSCTFEFEFENKRYSPLSGKSWRTNQEGMAELVRKHRIMVLGRNPYFRHYHADFPW